MRPLLASYARLAAGLAILSTLILASCSEDGGTGPGPTAASVAIAGAEMNVQPGETLQLSATAKDGTGNPLQGQEVTWSSSEAAVATVSSTGLLSAHASGLTVVRASVGSAADSVLVSVASEHRSEESVLATDAEGRVSLFVGGVAGEGYRSTRFDFQLRRGGGEPLPNIEMRFRQDPVSRSVISFSDPAGAHLPALLRARPEVLGALGARQFTVRDSLGIVVGPVTLTGVQENGRVAEVGWARSSDLVVEVRADEFICSTATEIVGYLNELLTGQDQRQQAARTIAAFGSATPPSESLRDLLEPDTRLLTDAVIVRRDLWESALGRQATPFSEADLAQALRDDLALAAQDAAFRRARVSRREERFTSTDANGDGESTWRIVALDLEDPYCGGRIPVRMEALEREVAGPTGGEVEVAVRVLNDFNEGVGGVLVAFSVSGEGGSVTPSATTDANGVARGTWTLPEQDGTYAVNASVNWSDHGQALRDSVTISARASVAAALIGSWEGTVTQPGHGTYPVVMVLDRLNAGEDAGTIFYPTLACSGTLRHDGQSAAVFRLREEITVNSGRCYPHGRIEVERLERNSLQWRWFLPTGNTPVATATLTRSAAP